MPVVLTRRAVVRQSLLGDLAVRNDRLNLVARFEPGRPPIDVDDAAAKPVFRRNPVTDPVGPLDAQCDTCKDVGDAIPQGESQFTIGRAAFRESGGTYV